MHNPVEQSLAYHGQTAHIRTFSHYNRLTHDGVIKWKYFPCDCPFVRRIHRSPVNSPHKGQWRGALVFFYVRQNKELGEQWWGWWFETPSHPLWRHCNVVTKIIVVYGKPNIILYLLIQQHLPDKCKFTRSLLKNIIGITRRVYGHLSIHIFLNDRFGIVCRLFTKCSVLIDSTFILQSYAELWRHIFILPQKVLRDILNFIT